MKFKIIGYDTELPEGKTARPKLFEKEAVATDLDEAKKIGTELALAFRGGWLRSASWMARKEEEKPTLLVYLSRRPPTNARLPRGYRYKRPE